MDITNITSILEPDFTFAHQIIRNVQESNSRFHLHVHDYCELIILLKGNVTYSVEGRVYKLKIGDIVYSKASVFHCIKPESDEPYDRYNIIFDEKKLPKAILDKIPRNIDVFRLTDYEKIIEILEKADYYATQFEGEALKRLILHLTEEIFYNLAISDRKEKNATINSLVDKAVAYIHDNLDTIEDIGEICEALYITKSHLHHIFVKNMQITPKQYIISKRLAKARKLIRHGAKPTAVAVECGFGDYATFFRNYKKYFGHSPSIENETDANFDFFPNSDILS